MCAHPRADLVVCLSDLWRDPLVRVSLPGSRVDGASDPAGSQLKVLSWEALGPEGSLAWGSPAMAFRRTEGMSMIQALAMTVAEIPVFLYTTFGQVRMGTVLPLMLLVPETRSCSVSGRAGPLSLLSHPSGVISEQRKRDWVCGLGPEPGLYLKAM